MPANRINGMIGESWMNAPERDALVRLLPETGSFLEIGTADGVTAAYIADRRPQARIVCVDTFPGPTSRVTGQLGSYNRWFQNRRPNMHLWVGTALDFCMLVPPGQFDEVLVDGEHKYDPARDDGAAAFWLVSETGYIAAHDFEHRENGVKQAMNDLCQRHKLQVTEIVGSMAIIAVTEKPDSDMLEKLRALGYA